MEYQYLLIIILLGTLRVSHGVNLQTRGIVALLMASLGLLMCSPLYGGVLSLLPLLACQWFALTLGHGRYFTSFHGSVDIWNKEREIPLIDAILPKEVSTQSEARRYGVIAMSLKTLLELSIVSLGVILLGGSLLSIVGAFTGLLGGLFYGAIRYLPNGWGGNSKIDGSPNSFRIPEILVGMMYGLVYWLGGV